jgi:hypothetical protein
MVDLVKLSSWCVVRVRTVSFFQNGVRQDFIRAIEQVVLFGRILFRIGVRMVEFDESSIGIPNLVLTGQLVKPEHGIEFERRVRLEFRIVPNISGLAGVRINGVVSFCNLIPKGWLDPHVDANPTLFFFFVIV